MLKLKLNYNQVIYRLNETCGFEKKINSGKAELHLEQQQHEVDRDRVRRNRSCSADRFRK